ncbi:MAG: TraR/DksA C4-type zinc finger protein [bacterium]|nr:TraR/DksA C4-type zinc finger protein [bacterium]
MKANIKSILEQELITTDERMKTLKQSDPFMDPDHVIDNAAVDTDVREQEAHMRIEAETEELNDRVLTINEALNRVEKGTYGSCKRCNTTIPDKRLELIPESLYCVACEEELKR